MEGIGVQGRWGDFQSCLHRWSGAPSSANYEDFQTCTYIHTYVISCVCLKVITSLLPTLHIRILVTETVLPFAPAI